LNNWKKVRLSELADITMGQSPKSDFYNSKGDGLPFLQGNRTFGDKYPTFDTWTTFVTKEAEVGDVIMSVRAPVGDINITPLKMCLGRGVCGLRHKQGAQEFLYYLLRANKENLINRENGTVFGSINKTDISNLEVQVPSLREQIQIGLTLKAIDDKIENNKKINHHLVEQAYAIYKEVCVNQKDDSFVEETIKSISQKVITGKTPSTQNKDYYGGDLPFITIPDMHNNIYCVETLRYLTQKGEQTQPSKTLPKNSIIVSCIATPGLVSLLDRESQTNQQINAVIPSENQEYYLFLELLSKSKLIIELGSSGSTTYNLNKTQFEKIKISAPSIEKRYELNNLLRPLFLKINQTQHETIKLSQLRDTLLPKLLSGEISVNQTTK